MPIAIAFAASDAPLAQTARAALIGQYGNVPEEQAQVIVALGGDGFMLQTLHRTQELDVPVYGMNRGTVGFLMNAYCEGDLLRRLSDAQEEVLNPLRMHAECADGSQHNALAINEVSLLRQGPQAPSCASPSMAGCGWKSWFATGRWLLRPRARPRITIPPTGRFCPLDQMFWR